ncbi:MAG: hypothetical protein FJY67_02225 [Calditrichaeota bacterium]|nr:hypothetical protein [Calditrichota bacterium]
MPLKSIDIARLRIGHTQAEFYLACERTGKPGGDFEGPMIILTPQAAKSLQRQLKQSLPGGSTVTMQSGRRKESIARQVIKALYKSRQVSSKMVSVNTSRRRHLPDKE